MKLERDLIYRILKKAEKKPDGEPEPIEVNGYDPILVQ